MAKKKRSKKSAENKDGGISTALNNLNINPPNPHSRDIAAEFADYFGNASMLANWQKLCRDLDIEEELSSVRMCRLVIAILSRSSSKTFEVESLGGADTILPASRPWKAFGSIFMTS